MLRLLVLATLAALAAAPAAALQLTPSQESYAASENIEVVAYNDGTGTISFASSDPYVVTNLTTDEVFTFLGLPIVFDVAPGESATFTVPGGALPPGQYEMEFEFFTPPWEPGYQTTTFEILAPVDAPPGSVSQTKSRYAVQDD